LHKISDYVIIKCYVFVVNKLPAGLGELLQISLNLWKKLTKKGGKK